MTLTGTGSLWLDGAQVQAALRYTVTVTQDGFMHRASGRIVIERHDAVALIGRLGPNRARPRARGRAPLAVYAEG